MRRRLDLAASLLMTPPILFLDEPTTGLDPRGRLAMWAIIRDLATTGTTVFLTTQYLEEADHLAQLVVVIDQGKVIATGTADELKTQIGGERLELTTAPGSDLDAALRALYPYRSGEIQVDVNQGSLIVPVKQGAQHLAAIVRELDAAQVALTDLVLRRPTLDDVFLTLTGHTTLQSSQPTEVVGGQPSTRSSR
jgi:ABC-2 type transport system ATP-binding protein